MASLYEKLLQETSPLKYVAVECRYIQLGQFVRG